MDIEKDSAYDGVMGRRNTKANAVLNRCGYKKGGAVKKHEDDAEEKAETKKEEKTEEKKKKFKSGGCVGGAKGKMRLDKYARGGATKAKGTTVNVIVSGSGQQQPPQKIPVPIPAGGPPPGGGMPPHPPMAGPPGGGMPPGGPPRPPGMKKGGAVKMDAGAGGGLGRIEKIKAYGSKPKK